MNNLKEVIEENRRLLHALLLSNNCSSQDVINQSEKLDRLIYLNTLSNLKNNSALQGREAKI